MLQVVFDGLTLPYHISIGYQFLPPSPKRTSNPIAYKSTLPEWADLVMYMCNSNSATMLEGVNSQALMPTFLAFAERLINTYAFHTNPHHPVACSSSLLRSVLCHLQPPTAVSSEKQARILGRTGHTIY